MMINIIAKVITVATNNTMSKGSSPAMSMMELGGKPLNDGGQVGVVRVRLGHIYPVGEVCYLVVVRMMVVRTMVVRMMMVVVVRIMVVMVVILFLIWGS